MLTGQNPRRCSSSYIEDDFAPTTPASDFAAGRNRAGYLDRLLVFGKVVFHFILSVPDTAYH